MVCGVCRGVCPAGSAAADGTWPDHEGDDTAAGVTRPVGVRLQGAAKRGAGAVADGPRAGDSMSETRLRAEDGWIPDVARETARRHHALFVDYWVGQPL